MRSALFLFAALNDTDMRWMAASGPVRAYAFGDTLIHRGENLNGLLIILSGSAVVDIAGRTMPRRAGECLGEMSLVDTRPASVTVTATEPTRALWLHGAVLRRRFDTEPGFAARCYRGLAILLANRLREATSGPDADDDPLTLDETMLDGMARAGERFRLLQSYTGAER
jgi:CRP-like cAMP-binding protein